MRLDEVLYQLVEMLQMIQEGKISGKIAKEILPDLLRNGGSPKAVVEDRGLGMISDHETITLIVQELLADHPDEVAAFRGGKKKLQGFFVGQLMKQTRGKVDPKLANQILIKMIYLIFMPSTIFLDRRGTDWWAKKIKWI